MNKFRVKVEAFVTSPNYPEDLDKIEEYTTVKAKSVEDAITKSKKKIVKINKGEYVRYIIDSISVENIIEFQNYGRHFMTRYYIENEGIKKVTKLVDKNWVECDNVSKFVK